MGRTRGLGLGLALLIATLSLVACATMGDPPPTLYKRLGGREGIAGDSRVNARFKDMKGPEIEGMKLTEAEWNAAVEDLDTALDKHKVGPKEKSELLGLLGPMKADIVGQ